MQVGWRKQVFLLPLVDPVWHSMILMHFSDLFFDEIFFFPLSSFCFFFFFLVFDDEVGEGDRGSGDGGPGGGEIGELRAVTAHRSPSIIPVELQNDASRAGCSLQTSFARLAWAPRCCSGSSPFAFLIKTANTLVQTITRKRSEPGQRTKTPKRRGKRSRWQL